MKAQVLSFLCSVFFVGCASKEIKPDPNALTVMTYNVENLFDTLDDPNKNDETYLPIEKKQTSQHRMKCQAAGKPHWIRECLKKDWSEVKLERKMGRLADVIKQIKKGQGPDLLILQEVENLNVLERLRQNHLAGLGYQEAILVEGPDERGIDVAILSKLPLSQKPILHEIDLMPAAKEVGRKKTRPTRGILQARFELPNKKMLTVFGVHFPSQGSPTPYRRVAVKKLLELKKSLPQNELALAAGDFNITAKEDGKEGLFHKELAQEWLISHQMGCDQCQGTHSYRGSWSFLDAILFSKNFKYGPWVVNPKSIRLANKSLYQLNHFGGPARFREGTAQKGVSDHFPLAADIYPSEVR
ncbi:MAG: endonuclease/exonuclease/phosphatase family protein [Pseudomonadota bacterium]